MAAKVNVQKLKQDAAKEESAGRIDKAIAFYRQVIDASPSDPKVNDTWKKLGDLYARQGQNRDASDCYSKVGDFFERDGFVIKAIAVWKQIAKLDPSDLKAQLKLADLYAKQNLPVEAKNQYQTVVDEYIKRGRAREAGEALKRIRDIDPTDLKVRSRLADLYLRDGDPARAVEEYIAIAEELSKKGHMSEALQVLEKGLKIAPASEVLRLEIGRIHLVQKSWDKAIVHLEEAARGGRPEREVFARLGEAYLGGKRLAEAEAVFKRLIERDPQDTDARAQLGRLFLVQGQTDAAHDAFSVVADRLMERREGDRAAAVLTQILQRQPGHIKTLLKLRDVYVALRKEPLVVSTYVQLSEAYIQQQRNGEAAAVLEELLRLEPTNAQHRSKLDFILGRDGGTATSVSASPTSGFDEDFGADDSFSLPSEPGPSGLAVVPQGALSVPSGPARPRLMLSGVLSRDDDEYVLEHMQEGRVFAKYGLSDKACEEFTAVVSRFPDHVEARTELRELLKAKGAMKEAAEQSLALAEVARLKGDQAGTERHEAEAREICPSLFPTPASPPPAAPQRELAPAVQHQGPEAPTAAEPEEELALDVEEDGIATVPEDSLDEEFDLSPAGEDDDLSGFVDEVDEVTSERGEELDLSEEQDEALDLEEDEEEAPAPPPPPRASSSPRKPAPPAPKAKPAPALRREPTIKPRARQVPPPVPSLRSDSRPSRARDGGASRAAGAPDLTSELRSLEESLALGFDDEAQETAAELLARHPDHPTLLSQLRDLGLDMEGTAWSRSLSAPPSHAAPMEEDLDLGFDEPEVSEPVRPGRAAGAVPDEGEHDLGDELGVELEHAGLDLTLPEEEPSAASSGYLEDELDLGDEPLFGAETPDPEPSAFDAGLASTLGEEASLEDLGSDLDSLLGGVADADAAEQGTATPPSSFLEESGLADMFQEFKKGVDRQLGREDFETRYNLGIAYKEMGLVDEAIGEFQLAAGDEARFLDCASMLGICFIEKGMPEVAISWFERGLEAPGRADEEYLGLRLELAGAFEAAGDRDRALEALMDLQLALETRPGVDPQIERRMREVSERIMALGGGRR